MWGGVKKTDLSPLNSTQEKGKTLFEDEGMFCLVRGVCLWLGLPSFGRVSAAGVPEPRRARVLWVEACPALSSLSTPLHPSFLHSLVLSLGKHRPGGQEVAPGQEAGLTGRLLDPRPRCSHQDRVVSASGHSGQSMEGPSVPE